VVQPLRAGDPARLGDYELLGRLGAGGMGVVYLGRTPQGRQVAIKAIRAEYAGDHEFRARFRSEVNRVRQVPPFSTAEVLDADPDHDPPYLVVEYVDGPSLADLVRQRGPLTGSALHQVAVGIATALTAIHGAGVIHRDLKPANVLFALGGPKVIDFGIARPLEATSQHTATDQMVGTVAYMAPERLDPALGQVGQAADIFAWGAVVTYAATGRTPFAADSAPATAMRILTQRPDLTGLTGPLRDLVEQTLAKNPAARPTARQLLDALLAQAPTSGAVGAAAAAALAPGPAPAGRAPVGRAPAPMTANTGAGAPATETGRVRRRGLKTVSAAVAVIAVLVVAGLLAPRFLDDAGGEDPGAAGATTPAATQASPQPTVASRPPTTAPSSSPLDPAAATAAILRGNRRTLIHIKEFDKDLELQYHNFEVGAGDGTGLKSLFVLVPTGVDYLIKSLRSPKESEESCLGVKVIPDEISELVAAECFTSKATLFSLAKTEDTDEKGRPTFTIYNNEYGFVQWDKQRKKVYVQEVGDASPTATFSFVDRGPA
jgi:eukaryotic-like serine/threonine-protein kinase